MQMPQAYAIGMAVSGLILFATSGCHPSPKDNQTILPIPQQHPVVGAQTTSDQSPTGVHTPPIPVPAEDRIAKQAEEHARAIEALLAARDKDQPKPGVRVIRPESPRTTPDHSNPAPIAQDEGVTRIYTPGQSQPAPSASQTSDTEKQVSDTEPVAASLPSRANTPMRVTSEPPSVETKFVPAATSSAESLEQQLARRAREYPRDLPSQLDYQLLLFTRDEQVPRLADIAGLQTEDREVLTALIDGLTNFRNGIRADNNQLMNRKIRPLVEMSDRLRSRADLSTPNAVLCREVKGYGAYTPLESTRFVAGATHKAIVYSEVENFASRLNDKNQWETQLEQQIVLYDDKGFPIWEDKVPSTDICRNRRRDFFIARIISIPDKLNMGRYVLKVSVTDQQASRIAETSIPFSIVAK